VTVLVEDRWRTMEWNCVPVLWSRWTFSWNPVQRVKSKKKKTRVLLVANRSDRCFLARGPNVLVKCYRWRPTQASFVLKRLGGNWRGLNLQLACGLNLHCRTIPVKTGMRGLDPYLACGGLIPFKSCQSANTRNNRTGPNMGTRQIAKKENRKCLQAVSRSVTPGFKT
jgi:hypothetical protein